MDNTYEKALAEVFEILKFLPEEQYKKIPEKLLNFIESKKQEDYEVIVKRPFDIQDYSEEAVILLGMIYRDYLCTPEEREEYKRKRREVNEQYQKEISEKYSVDKLFKTSKEVISGNEVSTQLESNLVVTNKSWFTKIKEFWNKIINRKK